MTSGAEEGPGTGEGGALSSSMIRLEGSTFHTSHFASLTFMLSSLK